MAKYDVLFACGHIATIQLYGKHSERDSYIEWCKDNRVCPECYEKAKAQERAAKKAEYKKKADEAKKEAESMGLPKLEGSETQVSWAVNIRQELLPVISEAYDYLTYNFDSKKYDKNDVLKLAKEWLDGCRIHTKATFWIDHRDTDARDFALECAKTIITKLGKGNVQDTSR